MATKKPNSRKKAVKPQKQPKPQPVAEAPPPTAGDDSSGPYTEDLIYVSELGRYALKRKGRFAVEHPVAKDGAFMHLVGNQRISAKDAKLILSQVRHEVVETVDCDPEEGAVFRNADDQRVANSYIPPQLEPRNGNWPTIRKLLSVLVHEDDAGLEWMLNWFAAKYQAPGIRSFTSVTIIGPQGVGKSSMGELFALLLGKENTATISGRDIQERFNSQFATRLWVVVNEVVTRGERSEVIETLKTYHTEERITLRTPHAKRVTVRNRMSLWLTSNTQAAVKLEAQGDRRYSVFFVPSSALTDDHKVMVKGMFDSKKKQPTQTTMIELAAFAHHLKQRKVDWDRAQTPFANETRNQMARVSRTALETFLDEVEETTGTAAGEWAKRYVDSLSVARGAELLPYKFAEGFTVDITYKAFLHFAHEQGFQAKSPTKSQFGMEWNGRFDAKWKRSRRSTGAREYVFSGLLPQGEAPSKSVSVKKSEQDARTARTDAA